VPCSAAVLFTCTLVRSRPDSNERVKCETRSFGTTSKRLGVPGQTGNILEKEDQQEAQSNPGSRLSRMTREVLQEDSCSSMYKL
jgi:hypothetical protein